VFRFVEDSSAYKRAEGVVICFSDKVMPLTEMDNIVPISYV